MFSSGERVRLVRHDQYPELVGLQGIVSCSGRQDRGPVGGQGEVVYEVVSEIRTLHDVPEAWLEHSGKKQAPTGGGSGVRHFFTRGR